MKIQVLKNETYQSVDNLPINLSEFEAYPQVSNEYDVLAKILVSYPSLKNSNTNVSLSSSSNILNNGSIIYLEHIADNFALPPIGDAFAANYIMPEVIKFTNLTRNDSYDDILNLISSNLLAPFSNYSNTKLHNTFIFTNFTRRQGIAFARTIWAQLQNIQNSIINEKKIEEKNSKAVFGSNRKVNILIPLLISTAVLIIMKGKYEG